MNRRSLTPLVLTIVLVAGVSVLGWHKLAAWRGFDRAVGAAVVSAYLVWALWEGRISLRDARHESVRSDRWTAEPYALAQGATAFSALLLESAPRVLPGHWLAAGALVFGAGALLRTWAVVALGELYSHRVRIADDHAIVRSGPYRWLRHPAYSGMLLAHVGLVAVFFNWVSATLVAGALVPAIVRRIHVEERALAAVPGYSAFCRHRARLAPLLW